MTFEELNLSEPILKALNELGFKEPTPIQEKVIPILLQGNRDVIGLAQTGTGKTAAYGLPAIQLIDPAIKAPQVVILCPTRELCIQITKELTDFSKYCEHVRLVAVYGGSSMEIQIRDIKKGANIVVATPGRILDLINRRVLNLSQVKTIILDEADEMLMLNVGFYESVQLILEQVPEEHGMLLFSATMSSKVLKITREIMKDPIEVMVGSKNSLADTVQHICYIVRSSDKYLALKRVVDCEPNIYGIVFCRTKKDTQEVADQLIQDGYNVDSLHGDLSQAQRSLVMQKFRSRNLQLLIATDVAARGLDVDDITHVIHYSLPDDIEVYNHRSGRTGRAGKSGISVSIVNAKERRQIREIEYTLKKDIHVHQVPTGEQVCERQLFHLIEKAQNVEINHEQIGTYLPVILKKLEALDRDEIIKRFVSLEFNRFLEYYKDTYDLNAEDSKKTSFSDRNTGSKGTRLFINVGHLDKSTPQTIIDIINQYLPESRISVGKIDIMHSFSFFEVSNEDANAVLSAINKVSYNNRTLNVEVANERQSGGDRGGYRGNNDRGGYRGNNDRGGYRGNNDRGGYRGNNDGGGYRGKKW